MAKKQKSLEKWCKENNKEIILIEWDDDKNSNTRFSSDPSSEEYSSMHSVWWKCKNGHEWNSPIKKRTVFGLDCPYCNPLHEFISIGTKYGCLTITEVAEVNTNDMYYNLYGPTYICVCECGKTVSKSEYHFMEKKHRYCTDSIRRNSRDRWLYDIYDKKNQCGLKTAQEERKKRTYKRVFDTSYNLNLVGVIHESLEVLECENENYEELKYISDLRKNGGGTYYVYKLYRCRCYLCGKEQTIKSSNFTINPPTEYGYTAYHGYWSKAYCDCHPISSFQWIVTKLLKENGIVYRVEVSFPDLYGTAKVNHLRFDFGIYDDLGNLKCLLECQGEQHFKAIEEFGGEQQLLLQQKNDCLKRKYAKEKGIPLYEIPYKDKKIERIEAFLEEKGILD